MSIDVMKQALEALEKSLPRLAPYGEQDWLDSKAAITAIKEAHSAPVQEPKQMNGKQPPASWNTPAAQRQPVAWPCHIIEADFSERTVTLGMECGDYKVSAGKHWLSTTPPQRKPLTDEEIEELFQGAADADEDVVHRFARAIEAAHGIGGKA